jgi:predicted ATP-dependent endonuclease of OLD family
MKITKIEVENFRLLKNFSMDLEDDLSLVIGKNNTGKTSILSVLDKFLNEKSKFSYDDFNIDFKNEIEALIKSGGIPEEFTPKGIKLKIFIEYKEKDDLLNVSRVLMDLDPDNNKIVLGFEYTVTYTDFLKIKTDYDAFEANEKAKVNAKKKNKPSDLKEFLKQGLPNYFKTYKMSFEYDMTTNKVNDVNFIDLESEGIAIKDIISFKYISARRDVTNKEKENTLSKQTSSLYKKQEDNSEKNQASENFNPDCSYPSVTG